jgi:chemotaxis protein methyltransferase CheR
MVEQVDGALADIELHLLLEAVYRATGNDFRDFTPRTLKRRVADRVRAESVATISALQDRVLHDAHAMALFVKAMSGPGHRLFAEPAFFRGFRNSVVPLLRTYSFTRIWIPNCVRAEDAYSLAVILEQEKLLEHCMIYATDASELAINEAKTGVFEVPSVAELEAAFYATGATSSIAEFGELSNRRVTFGEELKRNIVFAQHSLAAGTSLNEFHVIVSRDVLAQFNRALQFRVYSLLVGSLLRLGFLCLGSDESLRSTPYEGIFHAMPGGDSIFRRMR